MGINSEMVVRILDLVSLAGIEILEFGDQCLVDSTEFHVARDWYLAQGVARYMSIDINGARGAIARDLRDDLSDLGQFDLVTNFGTTEHIEGGIPSQEKAFRNIHNLCRAGGLMYHDIPLNGGKWTDHAPISYTFEFLRILSEENGYEPVGNPRRDINGDHNFCVRKVIEQTFVFSESAKAQIHYQPGVGQCGAFVCN